MAGKKGRSGRRSKAEELGIAARMKAGARRSKAPPPRKKRRPPAAVPPPPSEPPPGLAPSELLRFIGVLDPGAGYDSLLGYIARLNTALACGLVDNVNHRQLLEGAKTAIRGMSEKASRGELEDLRRWMGDVDEMKREARARAVARRRGNADAEE
jgi:hypothetical protein